MITRELLLTEFAAAILVGTIPCLLVTLSAGLASTVDFLKAIDISDFSVKYALALFIMSLAVSGLAHFKQSYIEGVNIESAYTSILLGKIQKRANCPNTQPTHAPNTRDLSGDWRLLSTLQHLKG